MNVTRWHDGSLLLRTAVRIGCLALLLATFAWNRASVSPVTAAVSTVAYSNPVFGRDFPDPSVLRISAHDYYAYSTITGWEPPNTLFPILHSTDLVHWQSIGTALAQPPGWSTGDWWAPTAIRHGHTVYLYYVGSSAIFGVHCIGVATASKPSGPFTDRGIVRCSGVQGFGYIDPAPFIDDNGKAYLYVSIDSPNHSIAVMPLRSDLLRPSGPTTSLFGVTDGWEIGTGNATVEAPFVIKHGATYDLIYSANDWQSQNYAMGYATASSPLGPFTKYKGNPILKRTKAVSGPGGGSLVQGPHGGWWLVYHAWDGGPGYANGGIRTLRIDPVQWHGQVIGVAGPTTASEAAP